MNRCTSKVHKHRATEMNTCTSKVPKHGATEINTCTSKVPKHRATEMNTCTSKVPKHVNSLISQPLLSSKHLSRFTGFVYGCFVNMWTQFRYLSNECNKNHYLAMPVQHELCRLFHLMNIQTHRISTQKALFLGAYLNS